MKRVAFTAIFLVALTALAWAQNGMSFEYEVKMEAPNMPTNIAGSYGMQTIRSWFQGDFFKMEVSNANSAVIIRKDKNTVWIVDNAGKKYMEFPLPMFEQMIKSAEEQAKSFTFEYKKTGRAKMIGRWNCYEVEVKSQNMGDAQMQPKSFMWVTKAKELDPKKLEETFKWDMWGQFRFNKKAVGQPGLDGYPVQIVTETTVPEGIVRTTMTLKNFETKQFPASIFELPKGYTKVEMPTMPSAEPGTQGGQMPQ